MNQMNPLTRLWNVWIHFSSAVWNKRWKINNRVDENEYAETNFPFDEDYYLAQNPDVKASGMRALDHYHQYGRIEGRKCHKYQDFMRYPAGHFYSPIVHTEEIKLRAAEIWPSAFPLTIQGVDLHTEYQKELLECFSTFYKEIPFPDQKSPNLRYYYQNPAFSYSDGILLYSFIRYFCPTKIIEVGSGYSSALILDSLELLNRKNVDITFIEPYPAKLDSLLTANDRHHVKIFEKKLEQIESSYFQTLYENDILFIDGTHVAKTGSDVNYLLFDILPILNKGVIIHFHDIFYPFEYPKNWVYEGRSWNEVYFLRSFLMYNNDFKVMFFSDYIHQKYPNCFAEMPDCYKNSGGSFWMRKVK